MPALLAQAFSAITESGRGPAGPGEAGGQGPWWPARGALSTRDAVDLAAHAAQAGASALMVVPPFYDAVGLDTFRELLREIYAASQLPIMFYNIPGATGLSLTPAEIASLAEVEGVRYLRTPPATRSR
jgi:dihydrodipicolinate synthase/N-acetylneuraminate lyase